MVMARMWLPLLEVCESMTASAVHSGMHKKRCMQQETSLSHAGGNALSGLCAAAFELTAHHLSLCQSPHAVHPGVQQNAVGSFHQPCPGLPLLQETHLVSRRT